MTKKYLIIIAGLFFALSPLAYSDSIDPQDIEIITGCTSDYAQVSGHDFNRADIIGIISLNDFEDEEEAEEDIEYEEEAEESDIDWEYDTDTDIEWDDDTDIEEDMPEDDPDME